MVSFITVGQQGNSSSSSKPKSYAKVEEGGGLGFGFSTPQQRHTLNRAISSPTTGEEVHQVDADEARKSVVKAEGLLKFAQIMANPGQAFAILRCVR